MQQLLVMSILILTQCSNSKRSEHTETKNTNHQNQSFNVKKLKVTTLSTMLANQGIGEWGYSALIDVDGKQLLFDTGRKPETVLKNAAALGIDLSSVEDVFLSHNHGDHTGGLLRLRAELKKQNPKAISRIHVGDGIFSQRVNARNRMLEIKEELENDGVSFIIYNESTALFPGVWITGPIDRIHPEKNYGGKWEITTKEVNVVDNIPEDQSLAISTEKGHVVIAGCGHAGIINTLEHVTSKIQNKTIFALIGGFHLVTATDQQLEWTAKHMSRFGVKKIIGGHCTGINALYSLRHLLNLERADAVVGSVGDNFNLENGINPGLIAK